MAFVYQPAVFREIANSIGLADKNLQDQLDATIVGSGVSQLISSRNRIASCIGDTTITNTDFDASTVLGQVFRSREVGISTSLNTVYSSIITGVNSYFTTNFAKSMRNYYDCRTVNTTIDFVSPATAYTTGLAAFRKLYSRAQSEELIYKLYNVPTTGVTTSIVPTPYGYSTSFTNSSLEIRLAGAVGSATTFTISGDTTTGSPVSLSVTVGAGTSSANVGTTQKFYNVSVLGVPASIGTTTVEIWTR